MPTGSHITISNWYHEWEKNGLWQKISRRAEVRRHHQCVAPPDSGKP